MGYKVSKPKCFFQITGLLSYRKGTTFGLFCSQGNRVRIPDRPAAVSSCRQGDVRRNRDGLFCGKQDSFMGTKDQPLSAPGGWEGEGIRSKSEDLPAERLITLQLSGPKLWIAWSVPTHHRSVPFRLSPVSF